MNTAQQPLPTNEPETSFIIYDINCEDECIICFHPFTDRTTLPCGHSAFCRACIQNINAPKCPSCRAPFTAIDLTPSIQEALNKKGATLETINAAQKAIIEKTQRKAVVSIGIKTFLFTLLFIGCLYLVIEYQSYSISNIANFYLCLFVVIFDILSLYALCNSNAPVNTVTLLP